jgi:cytochrome c oxidase subunit 2
MKFRFAQLCASAAILAASLLSIQPVNLRAQSAPRRIEISAKRFTFSPGEITLKKGEPVVIVLKSEDVAHGLAVKELGVNVKVPKGQTIEIPLTPDKAGDFVAHCASFCGSGHGSMKLTLHVQG